MRREAESRNRKVRVAKLKAIRARVRRKAEGGRNDGVVREVRKVCAVREVRDGRNGRPEAGNGNRKAGVTMRQTNGAWRNACGVSLEA